MLERVHHIAFIVGELESATAQFESTLGLERDRRETMTGDFELELAVYELDGVLLELISPTTTEGWVYEYWDEHGDGFFHIAFAVADIETALERFAERGIDADGPDEGLDWLVATLDEDETISAMQIVEET